MDKFMKNIMEKYDKNDYVEMRFLHIQHQKVYEILRKYCEKHEILIHKNTCLFFNKKNIEYAFPLITHLKPYAKICYSVNPRIKTDNIAGDYEHMKKVHMIYFDVEPLGITTGFQKNLDNLTDYLKRFGLKEPMIINSGLGRHILYKIKPQKITENKKEWYRSFVDELRLKFNTDTFRVDIPKDFTRVLGMPGSLNIKRQMPVYVLNLNDKINRFKIKSKRVKKYNKETTINAKDVLTKIVQILKTPLPEDAEINNVVWFNFKILLRDIGLDFNNLPDYIKQIRRDVELIQHYVYPFNRPADKYTFSAAALNNFCKKYKIEVKF